MCGWLLPAVAPPPQLVPVVAGVRLGEAGGIGILGTRRRPISAKAVGGAAGWGRVRAYRVVAAVRALLVYFPGVNVTIEPSGVVMIVIREVGINSPALAEAAVSLPAWRSHQLAVWSIRKTAYDLGRFVVSIGDQPPRDDGAPILSSKYVVPVAVVARASVFLYVPPFNR